MHALGNDFMVINTLNQRVSLARLQITTLADRHFGIGFDQLLLIEPAYEAHFFCRIFNADGSEAEQCGNGLRCIARFIHEEHLTSPKIFTLATLAGVFSIHIKDYEAIQVTLTLPQIKTDCLSLNIQKSSGNTTPITVYSLSLGNPHAIVKVDNIQDQTLNGLGALIATHAVFANGTNVGFCEVIDQHHIKLRTYERGVGETYACGSNACAAVITGIVNGWLSHTVQVEFAHGALTVTWSAQDQPLIMTGPATRVFDGEMIIE